MRQFVLVKLVVYVRVTRCFDQVLVVVKQVLHHHTGTCLEQSALPFSSFPSKTYCVPFGVCVQFARQCLPCVFSYIPGT